MDLYEIIDQVAALLQIRRRVTYRSLKYQFQLDNEGLAVLKDELIEAQRIALDEDGRVLVWAGNGDATQSLSLSLPQTQPPASYTPQHLAERIRDEQAAMEARGSANGERKTITALFADLKGSTALVEGLDPEDARAIIDPALQLMMDAVHRYDGYVAQALGDGIFALFGAPLAHEDHPQRALYAALRMQEEMRGYADTLRERGRPPLMMRVGLNTGEVVVRSIHKDDLHADYVPVGHSTNLAARMEQLAAPGSIVVTEDTHKLTDGYFEFKDLGKTHIKGVEEPLNVYEVLGAGPLRTRLQVAARRGLTRFVGRQSELDQLRRALEQAKEGHGQIVGVMGEAGLGKSRLFYEFKLLSQTGCVVLEAFSVSHGKASPYLPLIELLKTYFQIEPTDDARQRQSKVMGQVLTLDRNLENTLPYLFSLLGIDDPKSSLQHMDAQIRRQRTFEALKKLFQRESLNQPLLLLFEDLHWIDTETQGFLDTFSASVASAPLLLLVNYRPEYRHEWGGKTYYTQLRLAPLGKAEAEELLTFLLGTDASLATLKARILERTEGTPFFMEEVVQTLAEEGRLIGERGNYRLEAAPTELHISPTVQGVLAARIDRLSSEEKALLQHLSVIGRQFPVSLVNQVVPQSGADLSRRLSSLQAKEFLYEQPAFPEVEYLFKHALTQEVAYGTVLQDQRKALHERTGQAMEALYQDRLEDHYSELAHHYHLSGNPEKAVEYLHLAGQQALKRSANEEAVHALTTALALFNTLPDASQRPQQELALQIALGAPLQAIKGYGAKEVEQAYTRARNLGQQMGELAQLVPSLFGMWTFYLVRGDHQAHRQLAEQLLGLAHNHAESVFRPLGYEALGISLFTGGHFARAREHLEQSVDVYRPDEHRILTVLCGQDSAVDSLTWAAYPLWCLGYGEQAAQISAQAVTLAQEIQHPFSLALALCHAGWFHQLRQEWQRAHELAEATVTLSTEHAFPFWQALGTSLQGRVLYEQGQRTEGIALTNQGLTAWRATGIQIWRPCLLAQLADMYGQLGQGDAGLERITEALTLVEKTGERFYEAELYRLKGALLCQANGQSADAETAFLHALRVARQQAAKSWELRAATSLARLWRQHGKTAEARELLTPVYNWFTEGLDTTDLKDAKALLADLSEEA